MTHPGIFFVRNPPGSAAAFRLIPKREPGSISLFSAQPDDRSGQRAHAEDCQHSPERRSAGVAGLRGRRDRAGAAGLLRRNDAEARRDLPVFIDKGRGVRRFP